MQRKAVVFDLFETLITEWGHKKYTKGEICADLGMERAVFDAFWEKKARDRYTGGISFEDALLDVCRGCGKQIDPETLAGIVEKRIRTKSACYAYVHPDVPRLLKTIRDMGLRTAVVSNCSSEEVSGFRESALYKSFDAVVLSYEVHMMKPDPRIFAAVSKWLGVDARDCVFVGDGGSNELAGARNAGMKAIQAKWYTNRYPVKRDTMDGFPAAEEPLDVIRLIG